MSVAFTRSSTTLSGSDMRRIRDSRYAKTEIDQMDSDFKIWHDYLRSEIAAGQLSERVFTINNHYLSHLKQLMMKMGPLRPYSCRPMERTIKMFTNLITSTSNPAVNASNVFRRYLDYKRFAIQTIDLKHFPAKEFDPNSYRIHPDNTTNNHYFGELWEPFKLDTLTPSASRSSERQVCFGLKQSKVTNAFVRYYSRVRGRALMVSDINWGAVELASAVEKDGIVHGSLMDRKLRHLKTRSNAAVLFKATRKVGQRSVDVWLVAFVHCYLTHEQDGETRFLAVGEVMKKHEFDGNNVMTVTKNASGPEAQKIAVFSTEDILENVGLVQYSQNSYKFKVIWPYMCFYKGAGPLEIGRLTDV
ncbi:unnamed protein product [Mucor circinelloides]